MSGNASQNKRNLKHALIAVVISLATFSLAKKFSLKKAFILGGEVVRDSQYEAVYQLWMKDLSHQKISGCTGTLINPRVILTAAHCLAPMKELTHLSNSIQSKNGSFRVEGATTFFHPLAIRSDGKVNFNYDIGVILFDRDLPNSKSVAKISRPLDASTLLLPMLEYIVLGYGCTYDLDFNDPECGGSGTKKIFRRSGKLIPGSDRKSSSFGFVEFLGIRGNIFPGDSGGPIFMTSASQSSILLVGVNSFISMADKNLEQIRGYGLLLRPELIRWMKATLPADVWNQIEFF